MSNEMNAAIVGALVGALVGGVVVWFSGWRQSKADAEGRRSAVATLLMLENNRLDVIVAQTWSVVEFAEKNLDTPLHDRIIEFVHLFKPKTIHRIAQTEYQVRLFRAMLVYGERAKPEHEAITRDQAARVRSALAAEKSTLAEEGGTGEGQKDLPSVTGVKN